MEKTTTAAAETAFVVVVVLYAAHRTQLNLDVAMDIEDARSKASKRAFQKWGGEDGDEPLPVVEDDLESWAQDLPKAPHIWIQAFPGK